MPCASSISFRTALSRSSNSPRYFAPGDHGAEVERHDALVLQSLGDVAHVDAARETLDDRRLADAGLADQDRVVLRAPRKDLDDAADLLVTADDRVDLAAARELREIARVALQRLVLVLGVLVRDARDEPRTSFNAFSSASFDAPLRRETLPGRARGLLGQRQEEVLGGNVFVPELLRHLERPVEDLVQVGGEDRVRGSAADLRAAFEVGLHFPRGRGRIDAELLEDRDHDALVLLEQREEEVVRGEFRVAPGARVALRLLHRFLGFDRELVKSHRSVINLSLRRFGC